MALVRNGRSLFQNPGTYRGVQSNQSGNWVKGGLRNRFVGGLGARFGGLNNGSLAPGSFILPQKSGGIASYTDSRGVITPAASLVPARNLSGSASATITVTNAQLDRIVSAVASATGTISVSSAALAAAAGISANANGTITVTLAQLGAIFSVLASSSGTLSTNTTLTARAFMEAEAGGPTPLSPEGLAQAVWNALIADFQEAGSTGEALQNAGAAGNPWDALLSANNDPGTFGERVQKLLTKNQFLGLK